MERGVGRMEIHHFHDPHSVPIRFKEPLAYQTGSSMERRLNLEEIAFSHLYFVFDTSLLTYRQTWAGQYLTIFDGV